MTAAVKTVVHEYKGFRIERQVHHVAYARNGNTGNPTHYYRYAVYNPNGKVAVDARRLRDAKRAIDDAGGAGFIE